MNDSDFAPFATLPLEMEEWDHMERVESREKHWVFEVFEEDQQHDQQLWWWYSEDGVADNDEEHPHHACPIEQEDEFLLDQGDSVKVLPRDIDILFGRGNAMKEHEGNKYYREFIVRYLPSYQSPGIKRARKSWIVEEIYDQLRSQGRRFLLPSVKSKEYKNHPCELVVEKDYIKNKIAHLIRDLTKKTPPTLCRC